MSSFDKLNRFVHNPTNIDISRSRFSRPFTHKTTFNSGKLIPIFIDEVLPGDTFDIDISSVVRMMTPAVPVMDNCFMDIFFFFVPNRLCTNSPDDWQKICGENTSSYWANQEEHSLLSTGNAVSLFNLFDNADDDEVMSGSAMNYLGLPLGGSYFASSNNSKDVVINTMPLRAYCKIWNEFFRDQNLQAPLELTTPDFYTSHGNGYYNLNTDCLPVNKLHDYFTSALPSPQKGESVIIPIGLSCPVETVANKNGTLAPLRFESVAGATPSNGALSVTGGALAQGSMQLVPDNLVADLSQATGSSINQLRQAFAIQKMLERDARGGSRYREMLKAHFSVTLPDATAQVPEYLGGKRIPINVTQVLQTSSTNSESPLGSTGAFSNTGFSDSMFIKSFTEYGYILGVACVRTAQSYSQGIPRLFSRNRRFDFYYPVFANLGEQPIKRTELYLPHNATDDTFLTQHGNIFGYQEAWAEYRYHPDLVTGNFAPDSADPLLTLWTYTNNFATMPVLNSDFIKQPKEQIDQTLVTSFTYQFIGDFYFDVKTTRPMPMYSIPGLIDHH